MPSDHVEGARDNFRLSQGSFADTEGSAAALSVVEDRAGRNEPRDRVGRQCDRARVWSHGGLVCTGETYKAVVKMTFAKGAALEDPAGLFNASLEGNTRRAIDVREGQRIDEAALKALVRAAVALNTAKTRR